MVRIDKEPAFWPDLEELDQASLDARAKKVWKATGYAQSRRKSVEQLLQNRHGGPWCDTDDGEVWLEEAIPFVVEVAEILGHSAIIAGLKWGRKFCPLVSLDVVADIVITNLEQRENAIEAWQRTGRRVQWLPDGAKLLQDLRPTWDEVTELGLRGFASIDSPTAAERKIRKTDQRRRQRRAKGAIPRSSQTLMESRKRLVEQEGVSVRTIQRRERLSGSPSANVQDMSPRLASA